MPNDASAGRGGRAQEETANKNKNPRKSTESTYLDEKRAVEFVCERRVHRRDALAGPAPRGSEVDDQQPLLTSAKLLPLLDALNLAHAAAEPKCRDQHIDTLKLADAAAKPKRRARRLARARYIAAVHPLQDDLPEARRAKRKCCEKPKQ